MNACRPAKPPHCAASTCVSREAAALRRLAFDPGEPEWSVYSGALGRKFLRLDQFLKSNSGKASAKAEENVPSPKLIQ
jgi:hypothetical protein